jgi:hypothetical protein
MLVRQTYLSGIDQARAALLPLAQLCPHLVLAFAPPEIMQNPRLFSTLVGQIPGAKYFGCSTAGEIATPELEGHGALITAIRFDQPDFRIAESELRSMADSYTAGMRLGLKLAAPDLHAVVVLGCGLDINGSALIEGLTQMVGEHVPITGGLAGDGERFQKTWVMSPLGVSAHKVAALGLYGNHWLFHHGCYGGWQPFGPLRRVTRASDNILYELDGEPALDIYKNYLGEYAAGLPASGLLFPFEMLDNSEASQGVIRTILGVDEAAGSLILAGNVIPDGYLRLMYSSTDALVEGAELAARSVLAALPDRPDAALALLVSCVGRKLVMGERAEEEVESVAEILGHQTALTGFYSYGEICPSQPSGVCQLHNQTMTITHLAERQP